MENKKFHILSFKYALEGIVSAIKNEPNLKVHILIAFFVLAFSFILQISKQDFINIILIIGFVFSVELTNTSIETVVDAFTEKEHPGAKLSKDISAGAVLITVITAVALGLIIFLPYILNY